MSDKYSHGEATTGWGGCRRAGVVAEWEGWG